MTVSVVPREKIFNIAKSFGKRRKNEKIFRFS